MSEWNDATIASRVRLKPAHSLAHPRIANYTSVRITPWIASFEFRLFELTWLTAAAKTTNDGQVAPKGLDNHLVPA